jgi:alpha-mannosidase
VDLRNGPGAAESDPTSRSTSLGLAVQRALATAGLATARVVVSESDDDLLGEELRAELLDRRVSVAPGERASLRLSLRNCVAGEIRGEAQVISAYDTWDFVRPWTQGFAVDAGAETVVEFSVAPAPGTLPGTWWALVKVMYFGRLIYTESIPLEVVPS